MKYFLTIFICFFSCIQAKAQDKIPFDYYGHLYLKGSLNGAPSYFVFDTGAHNLYIDSCYYAESGLKFTNLGNASLPGAGTKNQQVKVVRDKLSYAFPGNVYEPTYGVIFSLRPILGDYADGIIGKDYFDRHCLEIDYEEGCMKKYSSISEADLTGFKKLQGKNIRGKLHFPLTVKVSDDITITDYFMLDLGSGGTLNINSPVAVKHNFENKISRKVRAYTTQGGVGGNSQSYAFVIPEVDVAGYTFKDVDVSYSLDKAGALSSDKYAGLLGNGILERFTIIIDFTKHCLYLKPNKSFGDPFDFSSLGFFFANRFKDAGGYWMVNGFYEGLPAEKSGIKTGDKIREVNNVEVKNISSIEKAKEILKSDTLNLKIERPDGPLHLTVVRQNLFP